MRVAATLALLLPCGGALATETVDCQSSGTTEAMVEMNFSDSLPIDRPNWVRLSAGSEKWSTLGDGAADGFKAATILQSFDDGTLLSVDVSDDQQSRIVASIRILSVHEQEHYVRVGTLQIHGQSVHPLNCNYGDE